MERRKERRLRRLHQWLPLRRASRLLSRPLRPPAPSPRSIRQRDVGPLRSEHEMTSANYLRPSQRTRNSRPTTRSCLLVSSICAAVCRPSVQSARFWFQISTPYAERESSLRQSWRR
eukprot:1255822-Pleurochrysis_carterae.AAC.1